METSQFSEDADVHLPEYAVPENIANLQDADIKFDGCLSKENYKERMYHLLYLEELERKKIMSRLRYILYYHSL